MSKHTPGPWRTHLTDDTLVIDAIGVPVATMDGNYVDGSHANMEANARLIAAAPDMLEEAQFLLARIDELDWSMNFEEFGNEWNGHVEPSLYRLKSAIAKAKGEA